MNKIPVYEIEGKQYCKVYDVVSFKAQNKGYSLTLMSELRTLYQCMPIYWNLENLPYSGDVSIREFCFTGGKYLKSPNEMKDYIFYLKATKERVLEPHTISEGIKEIVIDFYAVRNRETIDVGNDTTIPVRHIGIIGFVDGMYSLNITDVTGGIHYMNEWEKARMSRRNPLDITPIPIIKNNVEDLFITVEDSTPYLGDIKPIFDNKGEKQTKDEQRVEEFIKIIKQNKIHVIDINSEGVISTTKATLKATLQKHNGKVFNTVNDTFYRALRERTGWEFEASDNIPSPTDEGKELIKILNQDD
ncbi:MAG: hypothetical protein KGV51_05860 [Moraxellaceae bacterium]|nr:hypothetical protein [Moraxellaceae bacterium]